MKATIQKYVLNFKQPAGTSRGVLKTKNTWFLILDNGEKKGIGEINMFQGLSMDDRPDFEEKLQWICDHISLSPSQIMQELKEWPSILFGYETALQSLQSSNPFTLFPSLFTEGQDSISINGLVWMGDQDFMMQQLEEKLKAGFNCIKMKIGAIDFEAEMGLLKLIRSRFRESEITIRVDANGAFTPDNAIQKLEAISKHQVHSIEQPIKQGQWQEMAALCEQTPLDIALDEELIGLYDRESKIKCLDTIKPQYVILKPALVGGFQSSREWIDLATQRNSGWWITSALESNVGLNAIAQFTYTLGSQMPQGLGTGSLYTNNIDAPLEIKKGHLWCNTSTGWNTNDLNL
ncbi:o-succinylbenzoate synthase [Nonlabens dokdonensis]|uniref:Muconate cycloisomerase n=2 Tax=Nonlabens dokdonensis TaxID=328515 RepID=L7W4P5_NONDD|nr:o-succinylbenzoate synthase [Nonlabens dokdonensis]AGC75132.1 muconate cycloisomerase [Nonlabens dokdonensis DSW-6]PZX39124.1 o-succinylbenzoate synthase [Nonlabens dokdonensis]